jgi:hypothetical protein
MGKDQLKVVDLGGSLAQHSWQRSSAGLLSIRSRTTNEGGCCKSGGRACTLK